MSQHNEPVELVPVKNQLVPSNPLVEVVSAPVRIWRCGPAGILMGLLMVVLFVATLAKYDVVSIPAIPATPQPVTTDYRQQNIKLALAKIEADRDISIETNKAWAAAVGNWGKGLTILFISIVLIMGLNWGIRLQTIDEQRMKQAEE